MTGKNPGSRWRYLKKQGIDIKVWAVTVESTVSKVSASEIRVTLSSGSQVRVSGGLSALARREGTHLAVGSASGETPAGAATHRPRSRAYAWQ